jgi:FkbM family methyltransferase
LTNIVIEVGCNKGQDTGRLYQKYGLPVYGFEPIPELYTDLCLQFRYNPNVHLSAFAVDVEEGETTFNRIAPKGQEHSNYGCSSLYDLREGEQVLEVSEKIPVRKIRLDTFLDSIEFEGEIEYIHCDAQNNDLNVIKSFGDYLPRVKAGCIEVVDSSYLYGAPMNLLEDAEKFLSDNGFKVTSLVPQRNPIEYNLTFESSV